MVYVTHFLFDVLTLSHSFNYSAGKMWNTFPMQVVIAPSLHIFKERLTHICLTDITLLDLYAADSV